MMRFSSIQLAAGDSSRMKGMNKLMLKVDGETFVRRTLKEIKKADLHQNIIVTGFEQERIMDELRDLSPVFIHNPDFESGMHSSVKKGVRGFDGDGFFICLSDQPYFDASVMQILKDTFEVGKICVPVFDGKRGHPVLFSSVFVPEIMQEPDGDYGLSYLLKRHADQIIEVPMTSRDILIDVDSPEDYQKIQMRSYDSTDPVEEFHQKVSELKSKRVSFTVATVIEVIGSASAKTGSKAIFSADGKNILGWVGGGCAERFLGEESVAAIQEGKTRVVLADLDDEIFGLGVACGGKMRVFIEPILPSEVIFFPETDKFQNEIRSLASFYGWNIKKKNGPGPQTASELITSLATAIADKRHVTGRSLRLVKEVPTRFQNSKIISNRSVTIVGRTRITEALARHFTLLSYSIRAIGPDLKSEDYPSSVKCQCLDDSYDNIHFSEGEVVIIASHTSQDPGLVEKALKAKASYVGMIGSYKRSLEVLGHLGNPIEIKEPLYVPAGIDIDARNPDEIALSIVAEVIHES
jgi:molybdenum cofactor cytidylyltransferase